MKPKSVRNLSLALAASMGLMACNPLNKMAKKAETLKHSVTPNPLEMHGDSVVITVNGTIPPKYFHKKASATIKPYFKAGETVVTNFDSINLIGEQADGNGKKINYEKGGNYTISTKVPYVDGMERGELYVTTIGKYKTKIKDIVDIKLADGTNITPRLVQSDDRPIIAKDNFQRITTDVHKAEINYLINSSQVRSSETRDADIKALFDIIKEQSKDSTRVFKKLDVSAYASPDGELTINENLADNRAKSAGNTVKSKLKRAKIEAAKEDAFYNLVGKGEDWEGFKSLMNASDIEDKNLIIRVLQMYTDPAKREAEIKNLAETYVEVKDKVLPQLRRSQLALTIDKVGKTDEQILNLAKTNSTELNVEELLYASTLTKDMNEKLDFFEKCKKQFGDDWRGHNNAGYIYLLKNKLGDAESNFKQAASLASDNPIVNNNLGVIARLNGDIAKAKELYNKAGAAGSDVNYNKGIIAIIEGDYSSAKNNFGSNQTFNAALAMVLNGNPDGALNTINASEDKNSAEAYYLKAIIGARQSNESLMKENLKTAISKDASLKDKAMKDVEFIKYDVSSL